jgi:hypothetical protein
MDFLGLCEVFFLIAIPWGSVVLPLQAEFFLYAFTDNSSNHNGVQNHIDLFSTSFPNVSSFVSIHIDMLYEKIMVRVQL